MFDLQFVPKMHEGFYEKSLDLARLWQGRSNGKTFEFIEFRHIVKYVAKILFYGGLGSNGP